MIERDYSSFMRDLREQSLVKLRAIDEGEKCQGLEKEDIPPRFKLGLFAELGVCGMLGIIRKFYRETYNVTFTIETSAELDDSGCDIKINDQEFDIVSRLSTDDERVAGTGKIDIVYDISGVGNILVLLYQCNMIHYIPDHICRYLNNIWKYYMDISPLNIDNIEYHYRGDKNIDTFLTYKDFYQDNMQRIQQEYEKLYPNSGKPMGGVTTLLRCVDVAELLNIDEIVVHLNAKKNLILGNWEGSSVTFTTTNLKRYLENNGSPEFKFINTTIINKIFNLDSDEGGRLKDFLFAHASGVKRDTISRNVFIIFLEKIDGLNREKENEKKSLLKKEKYGNALENIMNEAGSDLRKKNNQRLNSLEQLLVSKIPNNISQSVSAQQLKKEASMPVKETIVPRAPAKTIKQVDIPKQSEVAITKELPPPVIQKLTHKQKKEILKDFATQFSLNKDNIIPNIRLSMFKEKEDYTKVFKNFHGNIVDIVYFMEPSLGDACEFMEYVDDRLRIHGYQDYVKGYFTDIDSIKNITVEDVDSLFFPGFILSQFNDSLYRFVKTVYPEITKKDLLNLQYHEYDKDSIIELVTDIYNKEGFDMGLFAEGLVNLLKSNTEEFKVRLAHFANQE